MFKSAKNFPTKCFPGTKFEHYCLYHEHVQEFSLKMQENFPHTELLAHVAKIYSFLSNAGNIFPALQSPN